MPPPENHADVPPEIRDADVPPPENHDADVLSEIHDADLLSFEVPKHNNSKKRQKSNSGNLGAKRKQKKNYW